MAKIIEILRASDNTINITLKDAVTKVALDLTNFPGMVLYVLDHLGNVLQKYRLVAKAGYDPLTIVDAVNGKFKFLFQSKDNINAPLGDLTIEVKTQEADADFAGAQKHTPQRKFLARLVASKTQNETNLAV